MSKGGRAQIPYIPLGITVLAAASILLIASRYHRDQKAAIENEVRNQLLTVADMRVRQLSTWREERRAIAKVILDSYMIASALKPVLEGRGTELERASAQRWLAIRCEQQHFVNAILTDKAGRVVLVAGQRIGDDEHVRAIAMEAMKSREVVVRDFHGHPENGLGIHLGYNVGLRVSDTSPPIGALLLGVDPEAYLYPLLRSWPTPSPTAETVLVRRDRDEVVYLSEVRHRPGRALSLRVPISSVQTPAVQAALGREGLVEGTDYRGVPVLAAIRTVPGTSWGVVAKVDAEEVNAPVRQRALTLAITVASLLIAGVACLAFLWRRQQLRFFKEKYVAEVERRELKDQLAQAQKMESIGRLAGGVAHDFNNQLTVINGYSNLLLKLLEPDDPRREHVSQILSAGEEAASLTRQLLAFSRKQVRQPQVLNLNRVVTETQKMLHRVLGEDVKIVTRLDPDLMAITADPGQINQVLMNLAVNARDAMPGGGRITVETMNVVVRREDALSERSLATQPGPYVLLMFGDTGAGMSPEVKNRAFEPFFTTKGQGTGTGLGLSTVYGILRQSSGWIDLESAPGEGARFRLYFPATRQTERQPEPAPLKQGQGGDETVLVVEDQEQVRRLAITVIRECGYRVLEAANGSEALNLADKFQGPIHLLVTDVVMPGMTGRELADRLTSSRHETKCLFTSGHTEDAIVHQGVLDPGVAYLAKPFTPEGLSVKVREVLNQTAPAIAPTVLVIDDEADVRGLLARILSRAGYRVFEAANGRAGMEVIRQESIALVITDLVMPEQEGLETLGQIRKTYPGVRLIAISGAFGGDLLATARHLGAHAALKKPVAAEELLGVVRATLQA